MINDCPNDMGCRVWSSWLVKFLRGNKKIFKLTQRTRPCRICRESKFCPKLRVTWFIVSISTNWIYWNEENWKISRWFWDINCSFRVFLAVLFAFFCTHSLNFHAIYFFSNIKSFLFACKCSWLYEKFNCGTRQIYHKVENQYSPALKASTGTEGYGIG